MKFRGPKAHFEPTAALAQGVNGASLVLGGLGAYLGAVGHAPGNIAAGGLVVGGALARQVWIDNVASRGLLRTRFDALRSSRAHVSAWFASIATGGTAIVIARTNSGHMPMEVIDQVSAGSTVATVGGVVAGLVGLLVAGGSRQAGAAGLDEAAIREARKALAPEHLTVAQLWEAPGPGQSGPGA